MSCSASRRTVIGLAAITVFLSAMILLIVAAGARGFIYVGDSGSPKIGRANLDGSGFKPDFIDVEDSYRVGGLALTRDHIYWAAQDGNSIYRARLDGSGVEAVIPETAEDPWALATIGNRLYWSDWETGVIASAPIDGGDITYPFDSAVLENIENMSSYGGLLYAGLSFSQGIWELDPVSGSLNLVADYDSVNGVRSGNHLYWVTFDGDVIGRKNLNSGMADPDWITTGQSGSDAAGAAIQGKYIYWVDAARNRVSRARLDGTEVDLDFLEIPGISGPWTIAVDWIRNDGANFKVKKSKKRKLTIDNPGPGRIVVKGKGVKKVSVKATGPNTTLKLKPKPALARKIRKAGKAKVKLAIEFRADLSGKTKKKNKKVTFR